MEGEVCLDLIFQGKPAPRPLDEIAIPTHDMAGVTQLTAFSNITERTSVEWSF
jgi:hypothetical protein